MAKAILEFDLNEPYDVQAHKRAVKSLDLTSALWDMDQYLRQQLKYNDEYLTAEAYDALEKAREKLFDIMGHYNISLDNIHHYLIALKSM
jgi:hypothetical protein